MLLVDAAGIATKKKKKERERERASEERHGVMTSRARIGSSNRTRLFFERVVT